MIQKLPNSQCRLRWSRLALMALTAFSVTVCCIQAMAQDKPVVLARMSGATITTEDFILTAHARNLLRNEPYTEPEGFAKLLDEMIIDQLVSLEAAKLDMSKDWAYRSQVRLEETSAALLIYQNTFLVPNLRLDSALVDSYYQAHIDRYSAPRDQRKIRQITVYKEAFKVPKTYITYVDPLYEGWDAKRKIDSIYMRLANGEDFNALVMAHSEELKAKATAGEMGWLSPVAIADKELLKPFFETPLHMISKPFETEYGWIIVQVTGERSAGPAPIDQFIYTDIVRGLQEEKGRIIATALTDSLAASGIIEYNDVAMGAPDSLIDPSDVMAIINGRDTLWGAGYFLRKHADSKSRMELFLSPERKEELLRPVIRMTFLYGAMREWGYLELPEVIEVRERKFRQHAEEVIRSRFTTSTYAPDSAEIARYYRDHMIEIAPVRRHQVEITRFADRDSAQLAMDAWRAGTKPGRVISQMVGPSDLPAAVWNKLAAVTPGSMLGPVAAKGEYWLLHLNRIVPPPPLQEMASAIDATLRRLRRENMQRSWVEKMSQRYGLVRYDDRLNTVRLPSRNDPRFAADSTSGH